MENPLNCLVFLHGSQAEFNYAKGKKLPELATIRQFADGLVGKTMRLCDVVDAIEQDARRFTEEPDVEVHDAHSVIVLRVLVGGEIRGVPVIMFVDEGWVAQCATFYNYRGGFSPMFGLVPRDFQSISDRLVGKTLDLREALMRYQRVATERGERFRVSIGGGMVLLWVRNGNYTHTLLMIRYRQ